MLGVLRQNDLFHGDHFPTNVSTPLPQKNMEAKFRSSLPFSNSVPLMKNEKHRCTRYSQFIGK